MRILETTSPIYDGPEGSETEVSTCDVAIDLEWIVFVRSVDDAPEDCIVQFADGQRWRVRESYSAVARAWKVYREGADALARIRN